MQVPAGGFGSQVQEYRFGRGLPTLMAATFSLPAPSRRKMASFAALEEIV